MSSIFMLHLSSERLIAVSIITDLCNGPRRAISHLCVCVSVCVNIQTVTFELNYL